MSNFLRSFIPSFWQKSSPAVTSSSESIKKSLSQCHPNPSSSPPPQSQKISPALAKRMAEKGEPPAVKTPPRPIPNVKHIVAIHSVKGGVGKSSTSVHLAMALSKLQVPITTSTNFDPSNSRHLSVGILDADIHGASIPGMLNLQSDRLNHHEKDDHPLAQTREADGKIIPLTNYGISCMSISFLLPPSKQQSALAWRGLILQKALNQLLLGVAWPELDVLVVDLPPGTGDVLLTMSQLVSISGIVLVTTPQNVALNQLSKSINFFKSIPSKPKVLGLISNMDHFVCPKCGDKHQIFPNKLMNLESFENVPIIGRIPLTPSISSSLDSGLPINASSSNNTSNDIITSEYNRIGNEVYSQLFQK